mmetsp:Transcript_67032/g.148528  ORF Transcript_67032/g.148528 Transcript_67032/m.148528 type:complete len:325 (+) Transcript_67032:369-1343(+)
MASSGVEDADGHLAQKVELCILLTTVGWLHRQRQEVSECHGLTAGLAAPGPVWPLGQHCGLNGALQAQGEFRDFWPARLVPEVAARDAQIEALVDERIPMLVNVRHTHIVRPQPYLRQELLRLALHLVEIQTLRGVDGHHELLVVQDAVVRVHVCGDNGHLLIHRGWQGRPHARGGRWRQRNAQGRRRHRRRALRAHGGRGFPAPDELREVAGGPPSCTLEAAHLGIIRVLSLKLRTGLLEGATQPALHVLMKGCLNGLLDARGLVSVEEEGALIIAARPPALHHPLSAGARLPRHHGAARYLFWSHRWGQHCGSAEKADQSTS